MGARQSRVNASSPSDVQSNLTWALNESVHWEEECTVAKMILSEAHLHSTDSSHSFRNRITMDKFPAMFDALQTQSQTTLARIDSIVDNLSTDSNAPSEYPSAHPAHAGLASRSFASAAAEQLADSISTVAADKQTVTMEHPTMSAHNTGARTTQTTQTQVHQTQTYTTGQNTSTAPFSTAAAVPAERMPVSQVQTTSQTTVNSGPSVPQQPTAVAVGGVGGSVPHTTTATTTTIPVGTTATVVSGPIDLRNSNTANPPAVGIADLPSGIFTADRIAQQERVEISAKFLFIYSLILKLVASAEHCYKLKARHDFLQSSLKSKTVKTMGQSAQASIQDTMDTVNVALRESLMNFDHARDALLWLRRDYELVYAQHRCHDLLRRARQLRNSISYSEQMYDSNTTHTHSDNTAKNTSLTDEDNNRIRQLNDLIDNIEKRKHTIERNIQHNERAANAIALNFLDTNNNGMIRPEAVPELSHRLFSVLDPRDRGFITKNSVNKAILKLSTQIDDLHNQLHNTSKDNKNNTENNRQNLQMQYDRARQNLREINWFLHQTFVRSVFDTMDTSIKKESIDLGLLQRDLTHIEGTLRMSVDPISTETGSNNVSWLDQASMVDKHQSNLVTSEKTLATAPTISQEALRSEHEPRDALTKDFQKLNAGQTNTAAATVERQNVVVSNTAPAAPTVTDQTNTYRSKQGAANFSDEYGYRSNAVNRYNNNDRYVGYGTESLSKEERQNPEGPKLYNTGSAPATSGDNMNKDNTSTLSTIAGMRPAAGASDNYATAPGTTDRGLHPQGASGARNLNQGVGVVNQPNQGVVTQGLNPNQGYANQYSNRGYVNEYSNDGLRGYYGTSGGYAYNSPQTGAYNTQAAAGLPVGTVPDVNYDNNAPAYNKAAYTNNAAYTDSRSNNANVTGTRV